MLVFGSNRLFDGEQLNTRTLTEILSFPFWIGKRGVFSFIPARHSIKVSDSQSLFITFSFGTHDQAGMQDRQVVSLFTRKTTPQGLSTRWALLSLTKWLIKQDGSGGLKVSLLALETYILQEFWGHFSVGSHKLHYLRAKKAKCSMSCIPK